MKYRPNSIHVGDCADHMAEMQAESVDLIVTSPPYDDLRAYEGFQFVFSAIAEGMERVLKPGGVLVWVVGDQVIDGSETGTSFRQALHFMDVCHFSLYDTMIYEKTGMSVPGNKRYHQIFEFMFVFSKGAPKTINLIKDRENKWKKSWGKTSQRKRDGDLNVVGQVEYDEVGVRNNIWRITSGHGFTTKDKIAYKHPAIFPEALARDHIITWSNPGDLVLDPMCGSGTTLKQAKLLGRDYIGFDISQEYVDIAISRLAGVSSPLFKMDSAAEGLTVP